MAHSWLRDKFRVEFGETNEIMFEAFY